MSIGCCSPLAHVHPVQTRSRHRWYRLTKYCLCAVLDGNWKWHSIHDRTYLDAARIRQWANVQWDGGSNRQMSSTTENTKRYLPPRISSSSLKSISCWCWSKPRCSRISVPSMRRIVQKKNQNQAKAWEFHPKQKTKVKREVVITCRLVSRSESIS